jgi:hypothetical protein
VLDVSDSRLANEMLTKENLLLVREDIQILNCYVKISKRRKITGIDDLVFERRELSSAKKFTGEITGLEGSAIVI